MLTIAISMDTSHAVEAFQRRRQKLDELASSIAQRLIRQYLEARRLGLRYQAHRKSRPGWRHARPPNDRAAVANKAPKPKTSVERQPVSVQRWFRDTEKLYEGVRFGKPGAFAQARELQRITAIDPLKR